MSSLLLEFRCSCGQLLFKGFLTESFVQIKCRRCKKTLSIGNSNPVKNPESYFFLYDAEGLVVDVVSTKETILGHRREEFLGKHVGNIGLHSNRDAHENFWNKANIVRFDPLFIETFHRHKNGELVCVHEHIKFHTINNKRYAVVCYEVVEKTRGIIYQPTVAPAVENISGPVAEINIDGFLTYVSLEFANNLFYKTKEMLGESFFSFCSKDIISLFKKNFFDMLHARRSFSVPYMKLARKNNTTIKYNLSFITTYQENNSLRGFVIVNTPAVLVDSRRANNFS